MKFSDLSLSPDILAAVAEEGYEVATPIQAQTIPFGLEGRDVLGCAQTGTGKTAAFALPVLHRLAGDRPAQGAPRRPRCLVLCPTRELAVQIGESFATYGRNTPLRHSVIFGGVGQNPQVQALRRGVDILIATPGRLLDLMQQGHVDLRGVETLVLDEADRMLDMGFINDIRKVVARIPRERQTMFFSATMPAEIRKLANELLRNPATVQVTPVASTVDAIDQSVYHVTKANKPALLAHLVKERGIGRAIVFTRTKHGADRVVKQLRVRGIHAEAIHGNKAQNARQRALENFRAGRTPLLVATDIASRGIDVEGITHVFNFDLTHEPETYVHRIGRTARAGAKGEAISFCDTDERGNLRDIERLIKKSIVVRNDQPDYSKLPHPPALKPAAHVHPHHVPARATAHAQPRGHAKTPRPAHTGAGAGAGAAAGTLRLGNGGGDNRPAATQQRRRRPTRRW